MAAGTSDNVAGSGVVTGNAGSPFPSSPAPPVLTTWPSPTQLSVRVIVKAPSSAVIKLVRVGS